MTLAFFMDHHIRVEITAGLRRRNVDVLTALEDGSARRDDESLLVRAAELGRVLVTQDRDFLRIAAQWGQAGRQHRGIVLALHQDADIGGTVEWLELMAEIVSPDEMHNRIEFILLRRG